MYMYCKHTVDSVAPHSPDVGWVGKENDIKWSRGSDDQTRAIVDPTTTEPLSLLPASLVSIPTHLLIKWWSERALLRACLKHPH